MDWMEFVASVIRSLSWPTALVVLGVLFRTQLRGLVGRLESATYKEGTLSFAREVEALSVHVAEGESAAAPVIDVTAEVAGLERTTESPEALEEERRRLRIAEVATWRPPKRAEHVAEALADFPTAAVVASYEVLQDGLTTFAILRGLVPSGASGVSILEALAEAGGLDRSDEETFRRLQRLRDMVASRPDAPSASAAINYAKVVDKFLHTVSTQLELSADDLEGAAPPSDP